MTINDKNPDVREVTQPQPRYQRHGRSRMSTAHSSVPAQPASDAQPGSAEGTSSALLASARNTLINGGQFTAATNVNRNVTINISEGTAPQIQTENCHPRQTLNRARRRRRGPMQPKTDSTGPVLRSNEIYERHLRLKKRGHPLWIPQPNMVLPIPYRAQGARIGDVGIFTENGAFDFLFNICVPRDDPINPGELPENFVPIYPSVNPTDIRKFVEFSSGSYLASSSVAESRTAEQSSGLTFESSASEGAILTMPEGAYSEDLSNISRFKRYIATHAEDWYKFVNGPRGREAQNGDVRVVVGCDKTTSWGMATFANSSSSQDTNFRLKFCAFGEQPSHCNAGNKYMWEHSGVAEVRVGPGRGENEELGETESNRLRNQCLFLRTLNVTLSEKVWKEIFPQTVVVADQNNSYSEIQDQSVGSLHGSSTGYSHPQPSQSNSSQNLPLQSRNSTESSTSDFTEFPENHRTLDDSVLPNPMELSFGNLHRHDLHEEALLPSTSKIRPEDAQSEFTSTPNVILTRSSSYNGTSRGFSHPSKIINQYLLEQAPHARVAVTHDKDWSSIIGMVSFDSYQSDPSQLLKLLVVGFMNDIVLDSDTGIVCLELKEINQNNMLSEANVPGLLESIKDGKFSLDQYLFGFHGDHCLRLQDLCKALRSGLIKQPNMSLFLTGHPERPLSLDELLEFCDGDFDVQDSIQRQSIVSLQDELSSLPSQHADRSSCLLRLGNALSRRFSQWTQRDDLEEAIWSYKEALSSTPEPYYRYLESLLGLCSSLYQRFYLLGHTDDLENLLRYLELQSDILNQCSSLLAPVEALLKQFQRDPGSTEEGPESGQSEDIKINPKSCPLHDATYLAELINVSIEADQRWRSKSLSPQQSQVHKPHIDSPYTRLLSTWDNDKGSTRQRTSVRSSASSASSNWRSSLSSTATISSTGTSSSASTRCSNSSTGSVSTSATSVSSTSWRTSSSATASAYARYDLPTNIKIMDGVPWELDQLPRRSNSDPVRDAIGGPPFRKRNGKSLQDPKLVTISERPTERGRKSPESLDGDASTSAIQSGNGIAVDTNEVKKVQKGQISALAKMLSALRR